MYSWESAEDVCFQKFSQTLLTEVFVCILYDLNLPFTLSCHSIFCLFLSCNCCFTLPYARRNAQKLFYYCSLVLMKPGSPNLLNNCFILSTPLTKNSLSWCFWVHKGWSKQFNIKSNQLCLHLMKWLSKQSCITIHVTTVYITAPADVTPTHFLVASLLLELLVSLSLLQKIGHYLLYHSIDSKINLELIDSHHCRHTHTGLGMQKSLTLVVSLVVKSVVLKPINACA